MESIKNFIKTVDRISKVLGLPVIRRYMWYAYSDRDTALLEYLDSCGYTEIEFEYFILETDYLYMDSQYCRISSRSTNYQEYDRAIRILKNMSPEEYHNMSDEELELLLKLN